MSMLISDSPYTGGDSAFNASLAGCACCVLWESVILTALLGTLKLGLTPITQRSVLGNQPEPLVNVNNANIFKCKQKVFLCFITLPLNGSVKIDHFNIKSLNYTMQLCAGDGQ